MSRTNHFSYQPLLVLTVTHTGCYTYQPLHISTVTRINRYTYQALLVPTVTRTNCYTYRPLHVPTVTRTYRYMYQPSHVPTVTRTIRYSYRPATGSRLPGGLRCPRVHGAAPSAAPVGRQCSAGPSAAGVCVCVGVFWSACCHAPGASPGDVDVDARLLFYTVLRRKANYDRGQGPGGSGRVRASTGNGGIFLVWLGGKISRTEKWWRLDKSRRLRRRRRRRPWR